jgi:hypothetical protein
MPALTIAQWTASARLPMLSPSKTALSRMKLEAFNGLSSHATGKGHGGVTAHIP